VLLRRQYVAQPVAHYFSQNFGHPTREGRPVVPPAPNSHPTDLEVPRGSRVAAKRHLECERVLTGANSRFKARRCYGVGTVWHRWR